MSRYTLMLFIIFACLLGVNLTQAAFPEFIEFESKTGNVSFSHGLHTGLEGVGCDDCHHMGMDKGCHDCHKKEAIGPLFNAREALHRQCIGCHKEDQEAGKATGPVKDCKGCHQRK